MNKNRSREDTIFKEDWPFSKAKSALLRSAAVVIRDQGPRSATLKNIAAIAGVTEPAIFRHFDGVDGVFQSLCTVAELFYGRFAAGFKESGESGLERLEAGADEIFAIMKDYPQFAYVIAKPDPIFRQSPKLKTKVAELTAALRAAIVDCLKEAKSIGELVQDVDLESFATAAAGALYQVMYAWVEDVEGYDPQKSGKKVFAGVCALVRKPGFVPKPAKVKVVSAKAVAPSTVAPTAVAPTAVAPKAAKAKVAEPKAAKAKVAEPKAPKAKAAEPKVAEPKAPKAKAVEPKATKPKAAKPKATKKK